MVAGLVGFRVCFGWFRVFVLLSSVLLLMVTLWLWVGVNSVVFIHSLMLYVFKFVCVFDYVVCRLLGFWLLCCCAGFDVVCYRLLVYMLLDFGYLCSLLLALGLLWFVVCYGWRVAMVGCYCACWFAFVVTVCFCVYCLVVGL